MLIKKETSQVAGTTREAIEPKSLKRIDKGTLSAKNVSLINSNRENLS